MLDLKRDLIIFYLSLWIKIRVSPSSYAKRNAAKSCFAYILQFHFFFLRLMNFTKIVRLTLWSTEKSFLVNGVI